MNLLTDLRANVYDLCRDFGYRAQLYRINETSDLSTGRKIVNRQMFAMKRVAFLPDTLKRDFAFQRLLEVHGIVDISSKRILIDRKQLPKGFVIDVGTDYLVLDHCRYELEDVIMMKEVNFYLIRVKEVIGSLPYETHIINYRDYVWLNQNYGINDVIMEFVSEQNFGKLSDWRNL